MSTPLSRHDATLRLAFLPIGATRRQPRPAHTATLRGIR